MCTCYTQVFSQILYYPTANVHIFGQKNERVSSIHAAKFSHEYYDNNRGVGRGGSEGSDDPLFGGNFHTFFILSVRAEISAKRTLSKINI